MNSLTTDGFWQRYSVLPTEVRQKARETYRVFANDPYHPSLQFKRVHATRPIFSVRIGIHHRALGTVDGSDVTWFWIGSHANYDKLVRQFRKS
jgi:hypothetical protein